MKILELWENFRVILVRMFISILFKNKDKPILYKHLELKNGMISEAEFQNWVITDGMGY